jgi:hypothetical protein
VGIVRNVGGTAAGGNGSAIVGRAGSGGLISKRHVHRRGKGGHFFIIGIVHSVIFCYNIEKKL